MCCVPMPCQTPRLDTHRVSEVPHVPETASGSGSAGHAPELHACQASPIHLHIAASFVLLAALLRCLCTCNRMASPPAPGPGHGSSITPC